VKKFIIAALVVFFTVFVALCVFVLVHFPVRHLDIIEEHRGSLDSALILAVIRAESSFREDAVSRRGAQGLMQLIPNTAQWMAQVKRMDDFCYTTVFEPEVNIAIGSFYLNWLVQYYHGNVNLALAAYNAGLGNVNRWLANPNYSSDGKQLDAIPFPETYHYLNRVRMFRVIYQIQLWVRSIFF